MCHDSPNCVPFRLLWLVATLVGSQTLTTSAVAQTKIACVGDSNFLGDYPKELQTILGAKYEVRSFGKDAATITKYRGLQFLGSKQFVDAIGFGASAVVISIGNDMFGETANRNIDAFEPDLRTLLERFRDSASHPKIYLWLFPDKPNDPLYAPYNAFCHPLARQAAREAGATVIENDTFKLGLIGKETATILDASIPGLTGEGENFYQDDKAAKNGANLVAEQVAPGSLKANWRIVKVSSFQADEGSAQNAIDGDPESFWHSQYDPREAKPPHEIVLDLAKETWLLGFKYLPRQDGGDNGNVKSYEIYVGDSPDSQTNLVAKGSFPRGFQQKIARFKSSVKARYIRFVCLSEQNGGPFASAAEIDIIRDPSKH